MSTLCESDVNCSLSDGTNQSVSVSVGSTSVDSESESEGEDWVRERREEWKKLLEYNSKLHMHKHGFPKQVWDINGITEEVQENANAHRE